MGIKAAVFVAVVYMGTEQVSVIKELDTDSGKVPMSLRNPTIPSSLRQLSQSDLLRRILHNSDKISWIIQKKTSWLNVPGKFVSTTFDFFFNSFKVP